MMNIADSGLSMICMSAFCADNASVNFGKTKVTELRQHNNELIPIGCICHILHNSCKKAMNVLSVDVKIIVMKCFNELSSSTKRVNELKELVKWTDL
ncbi:unnamed protein product [Gordionus sp. m RMFG-2023]